MCHHLDCFERLVLEAMIPFDRTLRTIDTNSIRECESQCKSEGERCQAFALGIDAKGNGTCQLTGTRIDITTGRRPAGTLYDPIFDIYQRRNCFGDATTLASTSNNNSPSTTSCKISMFFLKFK